MKQTKKIFIHITVATLLLAPLLLLADPTGTNPGSGTNTLAPFSKLPNPLASGDNDLMSLILSILNNIVMPIAAVGVVIWIIWSGFLYVMAQGKPAEIQKANKNLLYSLIGAGILLGAEGIAQVLRATVQQLIK